MWVTNDLKRKGCSEFEDSVAVGRSILRGWEISHEERKIHLECGVKCKKRIGLGVSQETKHRVNPDKLITKLIHLYLILPYLCVPKLNSPQDVKLWESLRVGSVLILCVGVHNKGCCSTCSHKQVTPRGQWAQAKSNLSIWIPLPHPKVTLISVVHRENYPPSNWRQLLRHRFYFIQQPSLNIP